MFTKYYFRKKSSKGKIVLFSILSALIASVATIFLTPKDGKAVRKVAKDKVLQTKPTLEKKILSIKDNITSKIAKNSKSKTEPKNTDKNS